MAKGFPKCEQSQKTIWKFQSDGRHKIWNRSRSRYLYILLRKFCFLIYTFFCEVQQTNLAIQTFSKIKFWHHTRLHAFIASISCALRTCLIISRNWEIRVLNDTKIVWRKVRRHSCTNNHIHGWWDFCDSFPITRTFNNVSIFHHIIQYRKGEMRTSRSKQSSSSITKIT